MAMSMTEINGSSRLQRMATNAAFTVIARAATLLLTVIAAPAARWVFIVDERISILETNVNRITPAAYTAADASKDFAMRDMELMQLTDSVKMLAATVGVVQQRQSERIPLFDEMKDRLGRLENIVLPGYKSEKP